MTVSTPTLAILVCDCVDLQLNPTDKHLFFSNDKSMALSKLQKVIQRCPAGISGIFKDSSAASASNIFSPLHGKKHSKQTCTYLPAALHINKTAEVLLSCMSLLKSCGVIQKEQGLMLD